MIKRSQERRRLPHHDEPARTAERRLHDDQSALSDEDLAVRKRDPFILQLNSGCDYSLLQNPAKLHRRRRHVPGQVRDL